MKNSPLKKYLIIFKIVYYIVNKINKIKNRIN